MPFHRPTAERTFQQALNALERKVPERFELVILIDENGASYSIREKDNNDHS